MDPKLNGHANPTTGSIVWPEIFARHEAVLLSHMEMLTMAKGQIDPKVEAFQTISSMVNKTVQAMNQLKIARKQMMNSKSREHTNTFRTPSHVPHPHTPIERKVENNMMGSATGNASSASASSNPPHIDTEPNSRKKRRRISRESQTAHTESDSTRETRASASSRGTPSHMPFGQDENVTSMSLGTEDISAEVQRRLKIKEEHRRKRDTPKQDKRKRDSLASNDGESLNVAVRPRKKRARMENARKRGGDS